MPRKKSFPRSLRGTSVRQALSPGRRIARILPHSLRSRGEEERGAEGFRMSGRFKRSFVSVLKSTSSPVPGSDFAPLEISGIDGASRTVYYSCRRFSAYSSSKLSFVILQTHGGRRSYYISPSLLTFFLKKCGNSAFARLCAGSILALASPKPSICYPTCSPQSPHASGCIS